MDPAVVGAWIGAGVALLAALVGAYFTISSTHRQRAVDLVVAALSHMGGGSQERSSGVAALQAMRGPRDQPPGHFDRYGWSMHGPAVGQQLFRQLIYVLNHAKQPYHAHEIENVIAMVEWLLEDDALHFDEPGQRHRLAFSLEAYARGGRATINRSAPAEGTPTAERCTDRNDTSIEELLSRINDWVDTLTDHDPDPASEVDPDISLEFAKYVWEEYRYRHDLIWRLLFRVTVVAALLSIVPFTISEPARENVGVAVDLLPAVALVLILASWGLLIAEWRRFEPINKDYRAAQKRVRQQLQVPQARLVPDHQEGSHQKRPWTFLIAPIRRFFETQDVFKLIVHGYPGVLFLLAAVVSLIVWI